MRSRRLVRASDCHKVVTVLGSIPASSDTVESEGQQMKHFIVHKKTFDGVEASFRLIDLLYRIRVLLVIGKELAVRLKITAVISR